MNNHPHTMLNHWYPLRDERQWVLGTVIGTEGSSYRKAGAMMLFDEWGGMLGLLSGGCVEKSLFNGVKRVLQTGEAVSTCFDASADATVAWQMGLGCGGKVFIQLQRVCAETDYQALTPMLAHLNARRPVHYLIDTRGGRNQCSLKPLASKHGLCVPVAPRTHLVVFGGGPDAEPLIALAGNMDWQVTLVEARPGYGLGPACQAVPCLREPVQSPQVAAELAAADAAIVMTHNISIDAEALAAALNSQVQYVGLLGPAHRKQRVLAKAGLKSDPRLHGPMGLDIGGELPESVALSTLAQCHQVLQQAARARSLPEARARQA